MARVEWHSAGKARAVPAQLWFGGERLVVRVRERACLGPLQAGGAVYEQFVVQDNRGRTFRIRAGSRTEVVELLTEF